MHLRSFPIFLFSALLAFSCSDSKTTTDDKPVTEVNKTQVTNSESVTRGDQQVESDYVDVIHPDARYVNDVFDIPELTITPSPDAGSEISFPQGTKVQDYDVSPEGMLVAALVGTGNAFQIKFWNIGTNRFVDSISLTQCPQYSALTWHHDASRLFVTGDRGAEHYVFSVNVKDPKHQIDTIYTSTKPLRRLVLGPRPFITTFNREVRKEVYEYRLFLGEGTDDGDYRIISITEHGDRKYQVVGDEETFIAWQKLHADYPPSSITADWALPLAFHPGGHELIWQNKSGEFFVSQYDRSWHFNARLQDITIKGGTITPTPNGLGLIHWQKNTKGIGVYLLSARTESVQLNGYQFIAPPSSVPDGKGFVGLTRTDGTDRFVYSPITMPLADVVNAWMFGDSRDEIDRFQKDAGLLRPNMFDQLYKLYETENYYCDGFDRNSPTRPYMVTTDIFWELFGAAYQGMFITRERDIAIPSFWMMIESGYVYYQTHSVNSKWKSVFETLNAFELSHSNSEVSRIVDEQDCYSDILGYKFSYSNLKPRGFYTATEETQKYFKAFKYFTTVFKDKPLILSELNSLPAPVLKAAKTWISAYDGFIAPSLEQIAWKNIQRKSPVYCQYLTENTTVFPLSWGIDNEIFNATIYHSSFPEELQISNKSDKRLLPSGLDLAAVLGSKFAEDLLKNDLARFPNLGPVIGNLKTIYSKHKTSEDFTANIYNTWMNALATQWLEDMYPLNNDPAQKLWKTKRLQTGLATWATLRHATVLVNNTSAAECGEGGFEEIIMRAPRGFVEPDPRTFFAIAGLFDLGVRYSTSALQSLPSTDLARTDLYKGIIDRLTEAAAEARAFGKMAEKEVAGQMLSNEENDKVLHVARVAEHLFLTFNSISNNDQGMADPDPMAKICDVAGNANTSHLMVAVGNSMEWDHVVPYYGRRQIVKGSVYSYYEFKSSSLLDDKEWRSRVNKQEFLPWVQTYITKETANGIATTLYTK